MGSREIEIYNALHAMSLEGVLSIDCVIDYQFKGTISNEQIKDAVCKSKEGHRWSVILYGKDITNKSAQLDKQIKNILREGSK